MKKFLKILLCLLAVLTMAAAGLFGYILLGEYKPAPVEELAVRASVEEKLPLGEQIKLISWNIGYGGLGKASDFFMDGGEDSRSADRETVINYLDGIKGYLSSQQPELLLLQEVDYDSRRSYRIDQSEILSSGSAYTTYNFACPFVPIPLPPIGRVYSGLMTDTGYSGTEYTPEKVERIALPNPFSWPVSAANLKRCLLVSYLPLEGSDKQLVLINLHLEAYDDGEGKIAQTKQLREFMEQEYGKGNYVIAGGDFNQSFPGALEAYPCHLEELWEPGQLAEDALPAGWDLAYDLAAPSCRLLNQPYDPVDTENTQHYVIDGFIISPNVELLEVYTEDMGFEHSDHNPVVLNVELKAA